MADTLTPRPLSPRPLGHGKGRPANRVALPPVLANLDWILVFIAIAIAALGSVMVFSATRGTGDSPTTFFFQRQLIFVAAGVVLMIAVSRFDYRHLRDWAIPLAGGALILLFGVLTPVGSEANGAQAWYQLAGFQLQPSEFSKLVLIIALAAFLSYERTELDTRRLAMTLGFTAVPMVLILMQPDLGTVLVFGATALGMVLVAGARPRHFAVMALVAIVASVVILNSGMLADFQTDRLTSFVNPDDSTGIAYNQGQSQIAIGAGGLTGQGLFNGTQTGLDFVPEQHTDFIFTVVGEETGFVGAATLLTLLAILVWRVWRTAQTARDEFGTLVCAGVMAMLLFHVFQNVGMALGIMPVTGIPLPLVSYGGSSILTVFVALGLVLSVYSRRYTS